MIIDRALGASMDIGDLLKSLGLEGYEAAFSDNEIDEAVLSSLKYETDDAPALHLAPDGSSRPE